MIKSIILFLALFIAFAFFFAALNLRIICVFVRYGKKYSEPI